MSNVKLDGKCEVVSPILREGIPLWQTLAAQKPMPLIGDVSPLSIPRSLLPHIQLVDLIQENGRTRYQWRLIGTHVTEAVGRDSTGRFWDEIYSAADYRDLTRGIDHIAHHKAPVRVYGPCDFIERAYLNFEAVYMPLANNDGELARIWIVAVYS